MQAKWETKEQNNWEPVCLTCLPLLSSNFLAQVSSQPVCLLRHKCHWHYDEAACQYRQFLSPCLNVNIGQSCHWHLVIIFWVFQRCGQLRKHDNMNIVSLTLQFVDVPLEIVQLVTQRPVYASIVIAHAVSIGLFLQELRAKGQSLYI